MNIKKKIGIEISEQDGKPLNSGNYFYWDAQWSNIILGDAGQYCPGAKFQKENNSDKFVTIFSKNASNGTELCGTSRSIEKKSVKIPEQDLRAFIETLDKLHQKSMDKEIDPDTGEFLHSLEVPNPQTMKSAWRVTNGFSQRLLVLWGYSSQEPQATILPLTPTSAKWSDARYRTDLMKLLEPRLSKGKFNWRKFFKWFFIVLGITAIILALIFAILQVSGHKCTTCNGETSWKVIGFQCDACDKEESVCECKAIHSAKCPQCGSELKDGKCRNYCPVHESTHLNKAGKCSKCPEEIVYVPSRNGYYLAAHREAWDKKTQSGKMRLTLMHRNASGFISERWKVNGQAHSNIESDNVSIVIDVVPNAYELETCAVKNSNKYTVCATLSISKDGDIVVTHPADDKKPGEDGKPADDKKPGEDGKPADDKKPSEDGKPADDKKPGEDGKPADDKKPGEDGKPADDKKPGEDGKPADDKKPGEGNNPTPVSQCPKCGSELKDGKCPKCFEIADYAFSVKLKQKTDKDNDTADAEFIVVPDKNIGDVKYVVHSWTVNGEQKASGDNKTFAINGLLYSKRYVIAAIVTINGKEQKVLPFQWNSVDAPVWLITRVGNSDKEYQVLCTNSSNIQFKVVKWDTPTFQNGKKQDISKLFECPAPVASAANKANVSWRQRYIGEYIMTLGATIQVAPSRGRKGETVDIHNNFVFINGSIVKALIAMKFANAKDRIYHCLATNTDGSQHNGTAFAVSDKLLLTNYHVAVGNIPEYYGGKESKVDPAKVLTLSNEKRIFYARVIKADRSIDMALLKICDKNGNDTDAVMPSYFLISENAPVKNTRVFSVGYPAGTTRLGEPAFTDGKIEHFETHKVRGEVVFHFSNIRPGYSGGPLVYMDNDLMVIGSNTSGVTTDTPVKQGVNIATSAAEIRRKFPEIFAAGKR